MQDQDARIQEIRQIRKDYNFFYVISGGIVLVLVGVWIGWQIFPSDKLVDYNINLWNTLLGAGVTILVIDRLNSRRQRIQSEQEFQARLVREAGSRANPIAVHAIDELRKLEWLGGEKGLLKGKDLVDADLSGSGLAFANLQDTGLWYAKLAKASLYMAVLKDANLWRADLSSANLKWANMENALLAGADLRGANLENCNLLGVKLLGFNRYGENYILSEQKRVADIEQYLEPDDIPRIAQFDTKTILPNGKPWTPETDMRYFTDRTYPQPWNPPVDNQGNYPWWYKQS